MSGKIYNKNLTFLQDQPFAENLSSLLSFKRKGGKLSTDDLSLTKDSPSLARLLTSDLQSLIDSQLFGKNRVRDKSEKMRRAETSLIKHFCLILERTDTSYMSESVQGVGRISELQTSSACLVKLRSPHLIVSVDTMRNTLLATRSSRSSERVKSPSQFKKILRESRKLRLLYGNLSRRHLLRATSSMRLPGENLLLWLESRLDVVLERAGFFSSVKGARHSVLSGKVLVNSKVVNSPGFLLRGGDLLKVIQERTLPGPRVKHLPRGVILSSKVFPLKQRNKDLRCEASKALTKDLPPFKSELTKSLTGSFLRLAEEHPCNKAVETGPYSYGSSLSTRGSAIHSATHSYSASSYSALLSTSKSTRKSSSVSLPYTSFQTWLLKKRKEKRSQSGGFLEHRSSVPSSRESPSKGPMAQNTASLHYHTKVSTSNNWRFMGSPHLLFSSSSFNAHLQEIMFSVAQKVKRDVLVGNDSDAPRCSIFHCETERVDVERQERFYQRGDCTQTNAIKYASTQRCCSCCSQIIYSGLSDLLTISALSNCCAVSVSTTDLSSCVHKGEKGDKGSTDILNLSVLLNIFRKYYQKSKSGDRSATQKRSPSVALNNSTINEIHTSLGVGYIRYLVGAYNDLFSSPLFTFSYQDGLFLSKESKLEIVTSVLNKGERLLLRVLLSDLYIYSLFIKRESLCAHLRVFPVNEAVVKNQKAFDCRVSATLELPVNSSRALINNSHPTRMGSKKTNIDESFVANKAGRLKPLHLEISYKSLSAVFLYPPQRVCLPLMVDLECLAKA